ncbi:AAA family ATPase [Rhizosaccharibacter radicis]|uniref:AAA family ATPase n=1 Tax=Rhizosaccharibacter radicis TaxID=2782605 RepID=A0ABT1VSC7_9PROT|nr:AAA family ATPase [Acetobacteraceae bacterium KSS12]
MTVMLPIRAEPTGPTTAGRLVAVASGKGGVGKTWLSITLAQAMAQRGRRVLLVDADLGLANVDIQLGLTPRRDLAAVIAGRATLEQIVIRYTPENDSGAFDVLPGRSGAASLATLDLALLDRMLTAVRRLPGYDTVLLDLGAGIDPAMRFMAASADTLLVITTDEPTALTDAYAVLKLYARDRGAGDADARVVVNQASSQASGRRTHATLARACETFLNNRPPLAGLIRRDPRVPDALRKQMPLLVRHPHCTAAEDIGRLATTLAGRPCQRPTTSA